MNILIYKSGTRAHLEVNDNPDSLVYLNWCYILVFKIIQTCKKYPLRVAGVFYIILAQSCQKPYPMIYKWSPLLTFPMTVSLIRSCLDLTSADRSL